MDIASLRKLRANDFSKITQAVDSIASGGGKKDEDTRFWKLTPDKVGNASAVIRFLPRVEGDELPWVKVMDHGFQGPGKKWYIEKSLSTIGEIDPVGELNSMLWNRGDEAGKEQARKQKRRTGYISNVLIINDSTHPENNGQVRLYKFGKKIMDKVMDKSRPIFEDEKPVNVFDYWEGADFKLRMKKVEGFPNYDASVFGDVSEIGTDDEIVAIAKQQHKLKEFIDPSKFKSYVELKAKLDQVLNGGAGFIAAADEEFETVAPKAGKVSESRAPVAAAPKQSVMVVEDDEQASADYFRSLAED